MDDMDVRTFYSRLLALWTEQDMISAGLFDGVTFENFRKERESVAGLCNY